MISQTSEYALRAVACLARRPAEPMTTQQIAVASRVSAGYLAKILQALARAGIVTGQRGLGGGFLLARRPEQLSLLDVVRVADGSRRITACPLGIPGHGPDLCPLHRRLDDAAALAEKTLSGVTIADVLYEPMCGSRAPDGAACAGDGAEGTAGSTGERAGPCRPESGRSPECFPRSETNSDLRSARAGTAGLSPVCDQHDPSPESMEPPAKSA